MRNRRVHRGQERGRHRPRGLKRLEYRGYDSAGVAVIGARGPADPARGRAHQGPRRRSCASKPIEGRIGIGHTRWATHGRPTDENAHPHTDGSGDLVVVHNGIIENYLPIKERLQAEGHVFKSETDTEVIAHLIERHLKDTPELDEAVRRALRELRGSYAVVVLSTAGCPTGWSRPSTARAAWWWAWARTRPSSPPTSRPSSSHTRDVVVLEDEDVAVVTRRGVEITQLDGAPGAADAHADPVGSDPRREGRLPALHAQGDLRAAARRRRHACAAACSRRAAPWCCPTSASTPTSSPGIQRDRPRRVRDVVSRRHRRPLHARAPGRDHRRGGPGLGVPLPRRGARARDARGRALAVGRDRRHARRGQGGARPRARPSSASPTWWARRSRARPPARSTRTRGRRSAWRRPRPSPRRSSPCYLLALWLGRRRGMLLAEDGRKHIQGLLELPRLMERTLELEPAVAELAREVSPAQELPLPRARDQLSARARRARSSSRSSPTSTPRATRRAR